MGRSVNRGKGSSSVEAKELMRALPGLGFTYLRDTKSRGQLWERDGSIVLVPESGNVSRQTLRQVGNACGMSVHDLERAV